MCLCGTELDTRLFIAEDHDIATVKVHAAELRIALGELSNDQLDFGVVALFRNLYAVASHCAHFRGTGAHHVLLWVCQSVGDALLRHGHAVDVDGHCWHREHDFAQTSQGAIQRDRAMDVWAAPCEDTQRCVWFAFVILDKANIIIFMAFANFNSATLMTHDQLRLRNECRVSVRMQPLNEDYGSVLECSEGFLGSQRNHFGVEEGKLVAFLLQRGPCVFVPTDGFEIL